MATSIENSSSDSDVLKQIGSAVGQPSPMSQSNSGASSEDPPAVSPLYAPWRRLRYESKCHVLFSFPHVDVMCVSSSDKRKKRERKKDRKEKDDQKVFPFRYSIYGHFKTSFNGNHFLKLIKAYECVNMSVSFAWLFVFVTKMFCMRDIRTRKNWFRGKDLLTLEDWSRQQFELVIAGTSYLWYLQIFFFFFFFLGLL